VRHVPYVARLVGCLSAVRALPRVGSNATFSCCQDQFVELGNPHPVNTALMLDFNFSVEAKQILALIALQRAFFLAVG
jgi:hypothetical protein